MQPTLENRILKDEMIKIPRKVAREMIHHKHYKALLVFLQLKPLYISGVIMNNDGKLPYAQLAAYLGLSVSGLRGKVRQLKKHNLLWVDPEKNFHLASYKTFVCLFQDQYLRRMRKYTYKNIMPADTLVRTSAIRENFRRQEYVLKHKIITKEIYGTVNAHVDRIKQPEGVVGTTPNAFSAFASSRDCHPGPPRTEMQPSNRSITIPGSKHANTDFRNGKQRSSRQVRRIRKEMLQNYEALLQKQKWIYHKQLEQVEFGLPEINPYITLSCAGLGRLFGVTASTGHYQQQKLLKEGAIRVQAHYEKINANVPAVYEQHYEMRQDVFSYNYPVRRGPSGREDKFFMRLPNLMNVNLNFIYENAKN